jgi:hypothetical protein
MDIGFLGELGTFIVSTVGGLITGMAGVWGWLKFRKNNEDKTLSELKKETKVNNVDGDTALINQLDVLLAKVTVMADIQIKIQTELTTMQNKELSYKSAFHRMLLLCDEVCDKSEFCKGKINEILTELKLT